MALDINPIIAGNARFYYADSEEAEPILQRPFRKAEAADFNNVVASGILTRGDDGSTIWSAADGNTNTGLDGTDSADTIIDGQDSSEVVGSPTPTTTTFSVTAGDGSKFTANDEVIINGETRVIQSVSTDAITLSTALSAAPAAGDEVLVVDISAAVRVVSLEWKPWQDIPLILSGDSGDGGSFTTEAAASGAINGDSLYLTAQGETVELPVSDA